MVIMVQFNPELAKSTPSEVLPSTQTSNARPGSLYSALDSPGGGASRHASVSSRRSLFGNFDASNHLEDDDDVPVGHHFTFIPPNPRKFYRRLLEYCLVADLEIMLSPEVDDNDEVSLGILSPPHIELINECALRWRIGHSYRASCFLDLVKQFYERNDVPLECIPEALQNVSKAIHETDLEQWPVQDVAIFFASVTLPLTSSFRLNTSPGYMLPYSTFSFPPSTMLWMRYLISKNPRLNLTSMF